MIGRIRFGTRRVLLLGLLGLVGIGAAVIVLPGYGAQSDNPAAAGNQQRANEVALRQAAWRTDDCAAQIALGNYYSAPAGGSERVEAAVWYFLAARPPQDSSCRRAAGANLDRVLAELSPPQQLEVRARVIYILASRGAEGFMILGRLSEHGFAVFAPDAKEALIYFTAAAARHHPQAEAAKSQLSAEHRVGLLEIAEAPELAQLWHPPFEYYPGIGPGQRLLSDESPPRPDEATALARAREIPPPNILEALASLGLLTNYGGCPSSCTRGAMARFQQDYLKETPTGVLSDRQTVRLIQVAAVNGSPVAQNRLSVMYIKGIGVPISLARAGQWLSLAARQGLPEALFNLSVIYRVGIPVIPADEQKATRSPIEAMMAGPSLEDMGVVTASRGTEQEYRGTSRPKPKPGANQPGPLDSFDSADLLRARDAPL